eukprot:CAMPEP_0182467494 /NCGR_PEP_ID=MMETSP1319-20130603/14006_1 /TAXON_ID=172717 /ORGANISM="Bolidomonas pacifica, Strain RCC208" /LENGTH=36 /DNA_ID= /DNA_START= /DNA_END= /DNA_ORIENTATION=
MAEAFVDDHLIPSCALMLAVSAAAKTRRQGPRALAL